VTDLLAATAELVAIPSLSLQEKALADHVEATLRRLAGLEVARVGDNVVARTHLGRRSRVVLAGHLDTVPPKGNERPRVEGGTLWGLGSTDCSSWPARRPSCWKAMLPSSASPPTAPWKPGARA
jgi:succinyl-diaminopimelate desuccinylase